MGRTLVTTSIPYVNGAPHIGHALELVQADVLARHRRQRGDDVRAQTGTDDNALKNVRSAEAEGIPVADYVARMADRFVALSAALDLSFDDFVRTSVDPRHRPTVERLWRACERSGDLYRKSYTGLYCVGCEAFVDGDCPEHEEKPELVAEDNWFFRLSRYQDQLARLIAADVIEVEPATRKREVLSFIAAGLDDFSVSRSVSRARGWGIPVPGDSDQVIYVWFDALLNYYTALGYGADEDVTEKFWPPFHILAKDILKFHAVYWPALCMAAELEPPRRMVIHGYLLMGEKKMSKSLGNVLDPFVVIERFGADALRFYLFREVSFGQDGSISTAGFEARYETELANDYGNLASRVLAMVDRYRAGTVPEAAVDATLAEDFEGTLPRFRELLDRAELTQALELVWTLVRRLNRFVEETQPWVLAKDEADPERLDEVLYNLVEGLRVTTLMLVPYLPDTAETLLAVLGEEQRSLAELGSGGGGHSVERVPPLFPKIDA